MAQEECLILIAEDEPPIAEVVAEVVRDLGCTPLLAADGLQALEIARARCPAVLITDLMLPHLSGAALIAALHNEPSAPTAVLAASFIRPQNSCLCSTRGHMR